MPEKSPANRAMKKYRETKNYDFKPDIHLEDYESETEYEKAKVRDTNKLNQANFVLEGRELIKDLHDKTHYRAS